ncbi:MAG: YdcF family protein [Clostridia bacterium]|nr:YdcF family protein [Clostridia bacterium]
MLYYLIWGLAILSWIILGIAMEKERSRYRNCYILFAAIVFSILALSTLFGENQGMAILFLVNVIFIVLLIVPFFLIINGILMIRREGHSLSNLLSLIFGIIILIGELATFVAFITPEISGSDWDTTTLFSISRISSFFSISVIYVSMAFVVFMIYCVFLQAIPIKKDFDYVIIHGAGLLHGDRVSKLLSDRLDKAIEVYRKDPTPPMLIPSGGQGSDEAVSEAEAMAKYLMDKGIPADKILLENHSTTTMENLKYSKEIIDAQEGRKYTVLVTSNYHVYRALRYCRKIGLKCTGVGSHVAFYYWPSALIREFIAVHAEKKHLFMFIAGWLACMIMMAIMYYGW